jgi:signal transduction histidine kinase
LLAWLAVVLIGGGRLRRTSTVLFGVMILAGALATPATNGVLIVPAAIGVVRLYGAVKRPLWHGMLGTVVAIAVVAIGSFVTPVSALALVSMQAGVLLASLVGVSRRQFRSAEAQAVALREERAAIREEQAKAAVLEQRQAVARDIHDVLAHSLGGLVIQLDAVGALLEAGRVEDAERRVGDARRLAAAGLDEARRAVDALRSTDVADRSGRAGAGSVPGEQLSRSLDDLVENHRSLGGMIDYRATGVPTTVDAEGATALSRALQEALTNARRHAPGTLVVARTEWAPDAVRLEVSNPVTKSSVVSGGGHGVSGMAERFAALPGSTLSAGEHHGRFVVDAVVPAVTRERHP